MGLIDIASGASAWRGYEYYKENKVCSINKVSENEYEGTVVGSSIEPYSVHIDIPHPKKSTCNCPFAEGNKKICKHKVALYFAVFPKEADKYLAAVEQAEKEAKEYEEQISCTESPSTRREWIEIFYYLQKIIIRRVSLHPEGVD